MKMFAKVLSYLKEKENFEKIVFWFLLLGVMAIGILFRTKIWLYNPSFWIDEMSLGYSVVLKEYKELFEPLMMYQVAPPFFLIVSKFLLNISGNANDIIARDLTLRFFPYLCSTFSLPLFAYLAHKISGNKMLTISAVAALSFNDTAINYAHEFKQYSTEMFFAILLLAIFCSIDLHKNSVKKILFSSIAICIAPWFSLSSLIIIACGLMVHFVLFLRNKCKPFLNAALLFLPFIMNFILWYFAFYMPVNSAHYLHMNNYWQNAIPAFFTISNFYSLFNIKTSQLVYFINESFIFILFLMGLAIFAAKRNYKELVIVTMPIILTILASFLHRYPYEERLILFLLPSFILVFAHIIFLLNDKKNTHILFCVFIIFISVNQFSHSLKLKIQHKSSVRELFLDLKNDYPNYDNLFPSEYDVQKLNYWVSTTLRTIDKESVLTKIKTMKKGEIFCVYAPFWASYDKEDTNIYLREIITNNPKFEILNYKENNIGKNTYYIVFKKI